MKHVIEAGTDAASLTLFDPGSLPDEFEARVQDDPPALFDALEKQGKACWLNVGADGGYLLHAFVDEPIPQEIQQYAIDPITLANFTVPSGRIYFTGAEYAFRSDDAFLRKHPHMGGSFLVRPGTYKLTLYRTEYPEGLCEGLLQARVSAWAFRLHQNMGCFVAIMVAAFLGLIAGFTYTSLGFWLKYIVPPLGFLMMLPLFVSRVRLYRDADACWKSIEREYPSIIAKMELTKE